MAAFPELIPFLSGNQEWVAETNAADPAFLPTLAKAQAPPVLWIGCADSRVPESVVLKGKPGDVFVHRNIANQFQSGDSSANAVLAYGVLSLAAQHVVVVGHTNCGGCNAAFASTKPVESETPVDHLSRFLHPLIELRHTLPSGSTAEDLVRANVAKSVENVVATETIKTAWAKGKNVHVHGWLYDLQTGLISDLGLTQGPQ